MEAIGGLLSSTVKVELVFNSVVKDVSVFYQSPHVTARILLNTFPTVLFYALKTG